MPPAQAAVPPTFRGRAPRRGLLRAAVYTTFLGAALTLVYGLILAREDIAGGGSPLLAYHQVVVPLFALVAMAGVAGLERAPVAGLSLTMLAALVVAPGGGLALVPGTVLTAVWAGLGSATCRRVLGYVLLIPGTAGGYYGALAVLSYATRQPLPGLRADLNPPLRLGDALTPFELLPLALLGAWLLLEGKPQPPGGADLS